MLNLSHCLCCVAIPDPLAQVLKVELFPLMCLNTIILIHKPNFRKSLVSMCQCDGCISTHMSDYIREDIKMSLKFQRLS